MLVNVVRFSASHSVEIFVIKTSQRRHTLEWEKSTSREKHVELFLTDLPECVEAVSISPICRVFFYGSE